MGQRFYNKINVEGSKWMSNEQGTKRVLCLKQMLLAVHLLCR